MGDGASGREQLCYQSTDGGLPLKLIFEHNEVSYSYFLFSDGRRWIGEEYCAFHAGLSKTTSAHGGLKLGLTEPETDSILGKPTALNQNQRRYEFLTHKIIRRPPPGETEDWEISGWITVGFSEHHANYISVTRTEVW